MPHFKHHYKKKKGIKKKKKKDLANHFEQCNVSTVSNSCPYSRERKVLA